MGRGLVHETDCRSVLPTVQDVAQVHRANGGLVLLHVFLAELSSGTFASLSREKTPSMQRLWVKRVAEAVRREELNEEDRLLYSQVHHAYRTVHHTHMSPCITQYRSVVAHVRVRHPKSARNAFSGTTATHPFANPLRSETLALFDVAALSSPTGAPIHGTPCVRRAANS